MLSTLCCIEIEHRSLQIKTFCLFTVKLIYSNNILSLSINFLIEKVFSNRFIDFSFIHQLKVHLIV